MFCHSNTKWTKVISMQSGGLAPDLLMNACDCGVWKPLLLSMHFPLGASQAQQKPCSMSTAGTTGLQLSVSSVDVASIAVHFGEPDFTLTGNLLHAEGACSKTAPLRLISQEGHRSKCLIWEYSRQFFLPLNMRGRASLLT